MTARLEDLVAGASLRGLVAQEAVTIVAAEFHGQAAVTLSVRRPSGEVASELVYRVDEERLTVEDRAARWTFDADAGLSDWRRRPGASAWLTCSIPAWPST